MRAPSPGKVRFQAYAVSAAGLIYAVLVLLLWDYTVDDSYIAYRYVENLAQGQGLVFNVGERVEGYSSLLWVMLLSPAALVGKQGPVLWSKLAGVLSGALLLCVCALWQRRRYPDTRAPLPAWALASNLALVAWSVAGLETLLYTLLVSGGLLALAKNKKGYLACGLLGLAAVTRPEGVLFCLIAGAVLSLPGGRWRPPWRWPLPCLFILLFGPVVAQLVFRYLYYGAWLPMPFYAKMGGGSGTYLKGLKYCGAFFLWAGPVSVLWLLLPVGFARLWRRERCLAVVFGAAIGAQCLFMVAAGGDWMKPFRFWVPVLPVLFVVLVEGYEGLAGRWWGRHERGAALGHVVFLIALAGMNLYPWAGVRRYTATYSQGMQRTSVALGRWLAREASPEDTIALGDVGALPYYSGLRVIDLYGLVNPDIARLAGRAIDAQGIDTAAILDRQPRYIVLESRAPGEPFEGLKRVDQKIYLEPRFREEYVLVQKASFSPSEVTLLFERRGGV